MNSLPEQLDHAADIDQNGDHRKGVMYALAYVIQGLGEDGYTPKQVRPLQDLMMALGDLDQGIQPKLLTKKQIQNAPKQGHEETIVYATASVLIDVLIAKEQRDGVNKGEAEEAAARKVAALMSERHLSLPGGDKTLPHKALLNWRENADYKQKNPIAVGQLRFIRALAADMKPTEAEDMLRLRLSQF